MAKTNYLYGMFGNDIWKYIRKMLIIVHVTYEKGDDAMLLKSQTF